MTRSKFYCEALSQGENCVNVGTTRALSENSESADYQTLASSGQGTPCPYNNKNHKLNRLIGLYNPLKHRIMKKYRESV